MHVPSRFAQEQVAAQVLGERAISVLPSALINILMSVPTSGRVIPLSYENRPYLRRQIDSFPSHPKHLYLYGRQSEKSTSLSAQMCAYTTLLSLTWQYVSATMDQAREFSQWKLDVPIRGSDILSNLYDLTGQRRPYNIKRKENFAGGRILTGTAYGDAARIRGNPADGLSIDEFSLIDLDAIGVLRECLSASDYAWELHAGTPLSTDNPMWVVWSERSKQFEWAVPCDRHTPKVWNVLGPKNLIPTGIVCERCRNPISTLNGMWVSTFEPSTYTYNAFRVPQIAVHRARFGEIYKRLKDEPVITMRESFAYSVEEANEVFTDQFLESISTTALSTDKENWLGLSSVHPFYAGIDWAQGGEAATVLSLGTYINGDKFRWPVQFRFKGDPDQDLEDIFKIIDMVRAHRIVADYGAGYQRNRRHEERYGYPRFIRCKYNRQRDPVVLDAKTFQLNVNRNEVLDSFTMAMRMHPEQWELPARRDMEKSHWWQDLRAVLVEGDHLGNPQFVRRSGKTDDHFHAMFYCFLASSLLQPRPDVLAPVLVQSDGVSE